nr:glycoprotein [Infectious hematopoietic necrosis virus]UVI04964.1 glycoprotein [Infectious hematopoietic necrosis virus]UVI04965.1 glycoprotein [Infectious hematopoietic necrosis virus]UVI04966.1 glycoprotein [Infectious hematopoietic necrosis virus]
MDTVTTTSLILILITCGADSQTVKPNTTSESDQPTWSNPLFTYPEGCTLDKLSKVNASQLRCPRIFDDENRGLIAYPTFIRSLSVGNDLGAIHTQGNYIHKVLYRTICSTGFFGGQTIEKALVEMKLSTREAGVYDTTTAAALYFPAPRCQWYTDNVQNDLIFYYATQKSVLRDPYTRDFLDSDFIGGKCTKSPCQTHWSNVVWMGDAGIPACDSSQEIKGHLFVDKISNRVVKATSYGHHPWGLHQACMIAFCGKQWIRTDLGDLISVEYNSGAEILSFPKCEDNTVGMRGNLDDFAYLDDLVKASESREECLEAHAEIISTNSVTPYLLSKFRSPHPGINDVYAMHKGSIYHGMCMTVAVDEVSKDRTTYRAHRATNFKKWERPFGEEWEGFHGLHGNNTTIIPDLEKYVAQYKTSMMEPMSIKSVPHPSILVLYNETGVSGISIRELDSFDLQSLNWSFWPTISALGGIPLVLLLAVAACCCWSGRPPTPSAPQSIPMYHLANRS